MNKALDLDNKIVIGSKALSRVLGCDVRTVYRYCNYGMPYTQITEFKRAYNLEQIREWLSSNKK